MTGNIFVAQHQKDLVTCQCMTHLRMAVYLTACVYTLSLYVWLYVLLFVNASAFVQLSIHAQCVCARAMVAYAVIQLLSGWGLSSWLIIYAAHWLFCHVDCSASRGGSVDDSHRGLSSWLICVGTHTVHTITSHTTLPSRREIWAQAHTSRLRVCHSSPERLLGSVLLPVLIVARAEKRDRYLDYRGELTPRYCLRNPPQFSGTSHIHTQHLITTV